MNLIDFAMSMEESIEQGRLHTQSELSVRGDKDRIKPELIKSLTEKGYEVGEASSGALSTVQGILLQSRKGAGQRWC